MADVTIEQQARELSLPERLLMEAEAWESWNAEFPKQAAVTTPPLLREAARVLESAAQAEARVVPEWLPIESAPRDGTHIILGYYGGYSEEGYWMADASRNYWGKTGWFATGDDVLCDHPSSPDCWMPMPAAPAPKEDA